MNFPGSGTIDHLTRVLIAGVAIAGAIVVFSADPATAVSMNALEKISVDSGDLPTPSAVSDIGGIGGFGGFNGIGGVRGFGGIQGIGGIRGFGVGGLQGIGGLGVSRIRVAPPNAGIETSAE